MLTTVNLISPQKKAELRSTYFLASARTLVLLVFTVSAFIVCTLFAVRMMLLGTRDDLESRSAQVESALGTVTSETKQINDYIARVSGIQARFQRWSIFLVTLTKMIPDGIVLESARVEGSSVTLTGDAETRDDVLLLKSRLEQSGLFSEVISPTSNILQPRDIQFDFQMTLIGTEEEEDAASKPSAPATPSSDE